jgi:hypothetical protein
MSALALFAAQRGIQTGFAIKEAFDAQAQAEMQSASIERQMVEIEERTKMQIQNIWQGSEKVEANQKAAFIAGGVELTGSAMSVISDTLNNAARAAYIRQRESDYDLMSLSMEQTQYDKMASNETLWLNIAAAGLGGASGFMSDVYANNRRSTRDAGATGIGGGGPTLENTQDAPRSTMNYNNTSTRGLA